MNRCLCTCPAYDHRRVGAYLTDCRRCGCRPYRRDDTPRPGPNDVLPCGSESARRRHLARAEWCDTCGVEGAVRLERVEEAA